MNEFDGAWRATYAQALWGVGLVILRSGKLIGCDEQYFFEGSYSVSDDALAFSAEIQVEHYAGEARSIFHLGEATRLMKYSAGLEGRVIGGELQIAGTVAGTGYEFRIVLTRLIPAG